MSFVPVAPPTETECEKNWLPIDEKRVIYRWHPLEIGEIVPQEPKMAKLRITHSLATPRWCRHLRGSAPPIVVDGELWVLTHLISAHWPRNYLHMWVVLHPETFTPLQHTPPFYLHGQGVEYCLGAQPWPPVSPTSIHLFLSVWDRESYFLEVSVENVRKRLRSF